ncbi:sce7726 family protein [Thiobacillus sp.]|uniref:sce7726 family protein n=1 Tax=Thiobacillus sp. TaxID=924 RepID=UPI00286E813B|nr:sce7726 family protein [Thiobacillus sp.]
MRTPIDNFQPTAVVRLFSAGVIKEIARKGRSPLFARLVEESALSKEIAPTDPIRELYDKAFSRLKHKKYRHEYVYKAAIAHKVLLNTHSLRTAAMLTEFRAGSCKADIVILNGTSTVYEIKSERDNLDRLQAQISAYRKIFAKVNVITGEAHLEAILQSTSEDVGVLLLTDRFQISIAREAIDKSDKVNPAMIFDSLQLNESRIILESYGIRIPEVPNTQMYGALRKLFADLPPTQAHEGMVRVLKTTRNLLSLSGLVEALPYSLRAAVLTTPLRQQDHARLLSAMDTPLNEALNWGK